MSLRKTLSRTLLATVVAAALSPIVASAAPPLQAIPLNTFRATAPVSQLIVRYRDPASANKTQTLSAATQRIRSLSAQSAAPLQARLSRRLQAGADLIQLSRPVRGSELKALLAELKANPAVAWAEANSLLRHTGAAIANTVQELPPLTPNDPYYANYQWHFNDAVGGVNAPLAWNRATGRGVVVAVIDTGIAPHPDLDANVLPGYDFISSAEISRRPEDGRAPGALDRGDWLEEGDCGGAPATPSSFHGTHVSGTIAEVSNNALGMAGLAHDAKILPVRVLGRCGGTFEDVADAITWASGGSIEGVPANTSPAEVINMSLGGQGECGEYMQSAIDGAVKRGTTVVVATGNSDSDAAGFTPANCKNVLNVSSTGLAGSRAFYSNFGASVDIAGPGGNGNADELRGYVWQTWINSPTSPELGKPTYGGMIGTSMATPHVAAVAAMVQSAAATPLSPARLETLLRDSTRPFPQPIPADKPIGPGLLDAKLAIDRVLSPTYGTQLLHNHRPIKTSGDPGRSSLYRVVVGRRTHMLSILTAGGTGNVNLYVSRNDIPTAENNEFKSERDSNQEIVGIFAPKPGIYYIRVESAQAYANVHVMAQSF